jgi:hypothetical protein
MMEGGCHCRAVRYRIEGEVMHHALCHCTDCRRHAGAPMVGWTMMKAEQLHVAGEVATYASSQDGRRQFCPRCGTSLFFVNEVVLPGLVDVQTGTLDEPEALPAQAHIQVAERIGWMERAHELPTFERFPPGAV